MPACAAHGGDLGPFDLERAARRRAPPAAGGVDDLEGHEGVVDHGVGVVAPDAQRVARLDGRALELQALDRA